MGSKVLLTGATGYVGGRLVPLLLKRGDSVRCLVREGSTLHGDWLDHVEHVTGDANSADDVARAAAGCRVAYFLIHSLGGDDFERQDRELAERFRIGCERAGVERVVYLGGLGNEAEGELSPHLASRQEVGRILAAGSVAITELRAAIILGSGSASFEMLRALTEALPVMVVPRWTHRTRCQPIDIGTVLAALVACGDRTTEGHETLELGGPEVMTYVQMMQRYATIADLVPRRILPVPVLTPGLSSRWVSLVSPLPGALARDLIGSLVNDVVVTGRSATEELNLSPLGFDEAVRRSIAVIGDLPMPTHWTHNELDHMPATPAPEDPSWAGGLVLEFDRTASTDSSPADVFAVITGIGGHRGWFWGDWMWRLRGLIDQAMGGVGLRRGRRHPDDLLVGDAVDFWRVDALVPNEHVRLRAEMWTPGTAWLEWRIAAEAGGGSTIRQRARFVPKGLLGRAYWYILSPFHAVLFPRLLGRIVEIASERSTMGAPRSVEANHTPRLGA